MDRAKKIDLEVKKIHKKIKRSNLLLKERLQDICEDMKAWDLIGESNGESREGYLR
jgi:hypothetical protein